jgi:hypothetical protein
MPLYPAKALDEQLSTIATGGTAQTINVTSYSVVDITLTDNVTLTMSGAVAGSVWTVTFILRQDGTGSRLVTWPTTKWAGGAAPTLTAAANGIDVVTITTVDGGSTWFGFLGGKAFA